MFSEIKKAINRIIDIVFSDYNYFDYSLVKYCLRTS